VTKQNALIELADACIGRYPEWERVAREGAVEIERQRHDIDQLQKAASAEANEVERLRAELKNEHAARMQLADEHAKLTDSYFTLLRKSQGESSGHEPETHQP